MARRTDKEEDEVRQRARDDEKADVSCPPYSTVRMLFSFASEEEMRRQMEMNKLYSRQWQASRYARRRRGRRNNTVFFHDSDLRLCPRFADLFKSRR
jgi:hypothetical protein